MSIRRVLVALITTVVASVSLIGAGFPASAVGLPTVTVTGSATPYSLSPTSLNVNVGDLFVIDDQTTNKDVYIVGAITRTSDSRDCSSFCVLSRGTSATYRVDSLAGVRIYEYPGGAPGPLIGTLALGTSGTQASASPIDPALVYPTASLDWNGGTCTGPTQFIRYNGQNDVFQLPKASDCARPGYSPDFWARSSQGPFTDAGVFAPGSSIGIGYESFRLYAIWSPKGVRITYDANVATGDACLVNGVSTQDRTAVVVVERRDGPYIQPSDGSLASSAPCSPSGMVLAGWKIVRDGALTGALLSAGTPVTSLFPEQQVSSASVTLAAQWKVDYAVTITADASTLPRAGSTTATVRATVNGTPVSGAAVLLAASGAVSFGNGLASTTVRTDANGVARQPISAALQEGAGTITAAYGGATSSVGLTVQKAISVRFLPHAYVTPGSSADYTVKVTEQVGQETVPVGGASVVFSAEHNTDFRWLPASPATVTTDVNGLARVTVSARSNLTGHFNRDLTARLGSVSARTPIWVGPPEVTLSGRSGELLVIVDPRSPTFTIEVYGSKSAQGSNFVPIGSPLALSHGTVTVSSTMLGKWAAAGFERIYFQLPSSNIDALAELGITQRDAPIRSPIQVLEQFDD